MQKETIEKARGIEKRYGSNYYLATLFFPKEIRNAVFVLYAFVRIPDEFVDNPTPGSDPTQLLAKWRTEWISTYETGEGENDIMRSTRELFLTYHIPFSLSLEFIDAMTQDLTKSRYQTYAELKAYMRGSADVVGIMLTHILGYSDPSAFTYAEKLGEAMQFTNFLRDIDEDLTDRNRIYLPQEDLDRFSVTEGMLRGKSMTPELTNLMKYEVVVAHQLFTDARPGIALLSPKTRRAVLLASAFYEGILDEIERQDYDIFSTKAKLSIIKKSNILIKTYVKQ
jgi:15-cis-phytoene synthase